MVKGGSLLRLKSNIIQPPKVFYPREEKPRNLWTKFISIFLMVVILLGGLVYFLFYSSYFKIKNIIVENSTNQEIIDDLNRLQGENILLFSRAKIEKEIIAQAPEITNLKVTRGLPDTLKIRQEERLSKIAWVSDNKKYLLGGDGVIFKEAQETNLPYVVDDKNIPVGIGQQVASENFINFLIETFVNFPQTVGFNINHFEISETIFQLDAVTDRGWKIVFDTTRPASGQLVDLNKFLSEHKDEVQEYVDLRVEGRVYYK